MTNWEPVQRPQHRQDVDYPFVDGGRCANEDGFGLVRIEAKSVEKELTTYSCSAWSCRCVAGGHSPARCTVVCCLHIGGN